MAKSTIIIADSDEKYLSSLEIKFLEQLGDEIELEIISQEEYFNSYFSIPRTVNVLVVSEELYTSELQRHNIDNVFVLTEDAEVGGTEDLSVERIFKYSNAEDIYKQIVAKSKLSPFAQKDRETTVAVVCSAAGGVGKTSIALGVCSALAKGYNKVLYINAQVINDFQCNVKNNLPLPNNAMSELLNPDLSLFTRISHTVRNEGFDYLPPFSMSLSSFGLDCSVYLNLIKSAKATKKYDVIVVDTDTSFDKFKTDLLTYANKVLIITSQNTNSVFATNMLLKNITCNDSEKYHFICNGFDENAFNALVDGDVKPNFVVDEHIKYFNEFSKDGIEGFSKLQGVQKVSYLLI